MVKGCWSYVIREERSNITPLVRQVGGGGGGSLTSRIKGACRSWSGSLFTCFQKDVWQSGGAVTLEAQSHAANYGGLLHSGV